MIQIRKKVEVSCSFCNKSFLKDDSEVTIYIRDERDVFLLTIAYNKAIEYFNQTNTVITQL